MRVSMTKRFLGLLLAVSLVFSSSTSVSATEGILPDVESADQVQLTSEDSDDELSGKPVDDASDDTEENINDISDSSESGADDKASDDKSGEDTGSDSDESQDEAVFDDEVVDDNALTDEEDLDEENLPESDEAQDSKKAPSKENLPEDFYDTFPTGYIDDGADYEIESVTDGAFMLRSFGSAYDTSYTTPNLPPLRNQSPYGACWAFATDALAEINLLKKGLISSADLSELHLAYFTYHWVNDPLDNFGAFRQPSSISGVLDIGGNSDFGLNTYARWTGVADETTANYKTMAKTANSTGLNENIAFEDVAHVENYFIEPMDISDLEPVKRLIVQYGAAAISYYAVNSISGATSANYYNQSTNAYYSPTPKASQNHAVTIVGWDDSFPKENFVQTPPGDGAWLIRNSWYTSGSEETYTGYFWMSYYEATLGPKAYAGDFVLNDNYDNNYQYDTSLSPTVTAVRKAANIFTAKSGSDIEVIKAASFYTSSSNVNYTVNIFTDLTDPDDPESGLLCSSQSGSTTYAGYYTVKLDDPVYVNKGESFAVVVECNDSDEFFIGKERHVKVNNNVFYYSSTEGQSFYIDEYSDAWEDNGSHGNMCIKAFTDSEEYTGEIIPRGIIFKNVEHNTLDLGVGESFKTVVSVAPSNATNKKITWESSDESVVTVENGRLTGLKEGEATVTATCLLGGASGSITVTVSPKLLSLYISASSSTGSIVEGQSVTLTAIPSPSDYTLKEDIVWGFSDESILNNDIVTRKTNRRIEGVIQKPGLLKVTCSAEGVTSSRNLYCTPSPEYFSYEVADDNVITFTFDAINGATYYEITRGDKELASIDDNGSPSYSIEVDEFKGVGFGSVEYTIRTYFDYYCVLTKVTVEAPYLINYHLNGAENNPLNPIRYYPGFSYALYPPTPPDDHIFEGWFTDSQFTNEIEAISSDMTGDIEIYAKLKSFKSTGITIDCTEDMLSIGESVTLTVTVLPEEFDQVFDLQSSVQPSDAATVEKDGRKITVTAKKTGTVSITVTNNNNISAHKTIHIVDIYPESLLLSTERPEDNGESRLGIGDSISVFGHILPEHANDRKVVFEVSDQEIISLSDITDNSAVVHAIKEGTAYVYAISDADRSIRLGHRIIISDSGEYQIEGPTEIRLLDMGKTPKLYASSSASPTTTLYGEAAGDSPLNIDISNKSSEDGFYDVSVAVGKTFSLKADFLPKADKSTPKKEVYADTVSDKNVSWTSGNTAIATVSNGKITAKSAGTTVITACSEENNLVAACRITVFEPVSSIVLDKTSVKLGTRQSGVLSIASVLPDSSSDTFSFTVNRPELVTLTSNGDNSVIFTTTGHTGSAVITVTALNSNKSAKCNVTVGSPVASLSLSGKGNANSVAIGKSLQLVTTFNAGNKSMQPINKAVTYEIVKGADLARVSEKGVLTGLKEGTVTIRVLSTTDNAPAAEETFVVYSAMKSASMSSKSIKMSPGRKYTVSAVIKPADSSCDHVTGSAPGKSVTDFGEIRWSTDSAKIKLSVLSDGKCTISADSEYLTPFNATVYATLRPYNAAKDTVISCKVRVESSYVTKLALNAKKVSMNRGEIKELSATLTPTVPLDGTVDWQINSAYAGIVRFCDEVGNDKGNHYQTSTESGNRVYIKALEKDTFLTEKAVVKAVAVGTAPGKSVLISQADITVGNRADHAEIMSGSKKAEDITVAAGKSTQLKAIVYADTANIQKAGSQKVVWKSLDENTAVVASNGKVTGVGSGVTRIYAAIPGREFNESQDSFVTVNVYTPARKLTLDKKKLTMGTAVDETSTRLSSYNQYSFLTADITPEAVFDNDGSEGKVTWTVSGTGAVELASVNSGIVRNKKNVFEKQKYLSALIYESVSKMTTDKGESLAFKAVKSGTVKITASAAGKSASCSITIYSHVTDLNLKAPIYDKKGSVIMEESDSSGFAYEANLAVKSGTKSLTLKTLLDYQGAPFSDSKGTEAYALYNYTGKYVINKNCSFISSDIKVAAVSAKGVVTAKSPGTCYITVSTAEGNIQRRVKVTVSE